MMFSTRPAARRRWRAILRPGLRTRRWRGRFVISHIKSAVGLRPRNAPRGCCHRAEERGSLMLTQIKFGRRVGGVMAEESLSPTCTRVTALPATWLRRSRKERSHRGRDPRFLGETFCARARNPGRARNRALIVSEPAPPRICPRRNHNKAMRHQFHRSHIRPNIRN